MKDGRAIALMAAVIVILWLLSAYSGRAHGAVFPTQYDGEIWAATDQWWTDYPDPKSLKGQLYQESKLDPNARSSVDAQGIGQFMEPAWREVETALYKGAPVSRTLAGPAIQGAAWYMRKMRGQWKTPRPQEERQRIAQASYNSGTGNILKAQRLCNDALLWADISPCLPQVTGPANAKQTTDYVRMIAHWRTML